MKKQLVLLLFSAVYLLLANQARAEHYFVKTDGDNNHTGLAESTAWRTISHATSRVVPGDTVHVKAGNYGNENVVMSVDGTAENPIVFSGYTTNPDDQPDLNWSYPDNTDFNPDVMPLLDGNDRSTGIGITLHSRQYVIIKNFQIQNYQSGVYGWHAEHVIVQNIFTRNMGDINADYSGRGIVFGSLADHNTIKDCVSLNAAAEGIAIFGDHNAVENSQVYCDDNSTGYRSNTDYYIIVSGNYNRVTGSYAERVGDLEHVGHGIGVKGDCVYNTFSHCTAKNFSGGFYVRHRGSKYNLFEDCTALNSNIGILVRDGASENTFSRCRTDGGSMGVAFLDTAEDEGAQGAGSDNLFKNCIFENSYTMISFNDYDRNSDTYGNIFINCTFYDGEYLFAVERDNHDNKLINSIVSNVQNFKTGPYDLNFSFSHSLFNDNGFSTPTGTDIISADPLFINAPEGNYHLLPGSAGIDAGTSASAPTEDFDRLSRPKGAGYDIGAYEYPQTSILQFLPALIKAGKE